MVNWQKIVREATKEAASAKWRDYALARLPEVSGFVLSKPKGFVGGSEAVYTGRTNGGVPLRVTVDKAKGVWRAEAGGLVVEDDIADLDSGAVQHALGEAAEAMDQYIEDASRRRKTGAKEPREPRKRPGGWTQEMLSIRPPGDRGPMREVADANLSEEIGADELRDHIRRATTELMDHEVGRVGDDVGALRTMLVGLIDRLENSGATYHLPFSPVRSTQ